jgi:hypothetical protein
MIAIANLQYGWTLFVNPIDSKFHGVLRIEAVAHPLGVWSRR